MMHSNVAYPLVTDQHLSVMQDAALSALAIRPDGVYVDGTYGRGGHSRAILAALNQEGRLLAFDKDPQACAEAWRELGREPRFHLEKRSFACLGAVADEQGLTGKVDGLLLDLGVSSPQLDTPERGFSFRHDGPLDMRMDPQAGQSVAEWLAAASREQISEVLRIYGEERHHWRIAGAIVRERENQPVETTRQLAALIEQNVPAAHRQKIHPATRSFQALRIFINGELDDLQAVLEQSIDVLAPGGRLVVISFHSLEDRIVKRFMRDLARPEQPALPMAPAIEPLFRLCGKAQRASAAEVDINPRSRSAVMRVAERTSVVRKA